MKFRLTCITALALAVAGLSLAAGPATAASGYCSGSGINVAIDFGALGGGVQKACDTADRNTVASTAIQHAGFTLTYLQSGSMSGFVCTVDGKPTSSQGGCSGAGGSGYWALFVANKGGQWTYASLGADSQPVTAGQTVSFAWQPPGSGQRNPATEPAGTTGARAPKPPAHTSTRAPSTPESSKAGTATKPSAAITSITASPRPAEKVKRGKRSQVSASASPTATATAAVSATPAAIAPQASKSGSGLPWWIPVAIVILLILGASGAWWRKRAGS